MLFKQFLAENSSTLTALEEFKSIQKIDPIFAKKLQSAWEGDERDYIKNKKIDSLFLKMLQPNIIQKMSKLRDDSLTKEFIKKLITVYTKAMPPVNSQHTHIPKFVDKSVWEYERYSRE